MKHYFILAVCLLFFSCQKDTETTLVPLTANSILGSWQLKSSYVSPGAATEWKAVENGDILKFAIDNTFTQTNTFEANSDKSGTYTLSDDFLKLIFLKDGDETTQSFSVQISKKNMTLSPAGPIFCSEPCLYRYDKID